MGAKKQEGREEECEGDNKGTSDGEVKKRERRLLTGHTLTDLNIGGEKDVLGLETRKIYNIWGAEAAGKSFFCGNMVGYMHSKYGEDFVWKYDDPEGGFSFSNGGEDLFGVEVLSEDEVCSNTIDELLKNFTKFCKTIPKNGFGLYIVDSLDVLPTAEQMAIIEHNVSSDAKEKHSMGAAARGLFLKQTFFPQVLKLQREYDVTLFFVSQASANITKTGQGAKYRVGGGMAKQHANSTLIEIKNPVKKTITKEGRSYTTEITSTVVTKKGRNSRPFRENYFTCIFAYGVDTLGDNIDFLYKLRTDGGKESTSTKKLGWDEQEFTKESLIKYIEENDQEDKLESLVMEKWEKIEDSLMPKRKKKF